MKKIMLLFGMAAVLMGSIKSVSYAAEKPTVEFTADNKLVYNISREDGSNVNLGNTFEGMAPGETREQKIEIVNNNSHRVDFYMNAEALEALEVAGKSAGGAYDISLKLDDTVLYDSTVGGSVQDAGNISDSEKGFLEMNDGSLKNTVFLVTLEKGEHAELIFSVGLDGESITNTTENDYSNALGKFGFDFLVAYNDPAGTVTVERVERKTTEPRLEVVETVKDVVVAVKTGDPAAIGTLLAILALGVFIVVFAGRKKKKDELAK